MKVDFNPSVRFRANSYESNSNQTNPNLKEQIHTDIHTEQSNKSFNESIGKLWKFITVANRMANAALKGLFYGALTGGAVLTGSWLFKSLPKAFSKDGPSILHTMRYPLKNISKSAKIIAGAASAFVLGYHLLIGKLDANQKTAVIDHKLYTGHRMV